MTVRHNGVVIHDDLELPAATRRPAPVKEGPEPGPVFFRTTATRSDTATSGSFQPINSTIMVAIKAYSTIQGGQSYLGYPLGD